MRQRALSADDPRTPARRSRHGLSADEIDDLIALQGGGCGICGRTGRPLGLDHDHAHCAGATGCRRCVRGALCNRCNRVVYLIDDSPGLARSFMAYLERTGSRP